MTTKKTIINILERWTGEADISDETVLFGSGLNISSVKFIEFVMDVEEIFKIDIDIDDLDASIVTAGQISDLLASLVKSSLGEILPADDGCQP